MHDESVEAQKTWTRISGGRPINAKAKVLPEVAAMVPPAERLRMLDWNYFAEQRTAIVDQWNRVINR